MSIQLLKSTTVVGGMTLISRILGFIREIVAAHFFGASSGYDAFIIASKIPNFMRRLFAEGAFSQAFVPILSEYKTERPKEEVQQLINRVAGTLTTVLTAVTIFGILCAPLFVLLFAPGFASSHDETRMALASTMLKITFPYLLFVSLTAFAGGILNTYGKFAAPAFTPVLLNIAIIIAAVVVSPLMNEPVIALAWGTLAGGIVQLLFQYPFLRKIQLVPIPAWHWKDKGVRRILLLMVPALLGVSVNQLNIMLGSVFASFLPVGSVSWLYYAERLMEFPLGGFIVALATVVLPRLSQQHTMAKHDGFSATLDWGIRWGLLVGLPAAIGLALLAGPLLTTLFLSGLFTEHDVMMSKQSLMSYSIGIIGFMLVKILASAYYAKQDIKTPVRFAMMTVLLNAILSGLLIIPLAHAGLALATSLASLLNAGLLGFNLFRRKLYIIQPGWMLLLGRLLLASLVMILVITQFSPPLEAWFNFNPMKRVWMLGLIVLSSGLAYIVTLFASGLRVDHVLVRATET